MCGHVKSSSPCRPIRDTAQANTAFQAVEARCGRSHAQLLLAELRFAGALAAGDISADALELTSSFTPQLASDSEWTSSANSTVCQWTGITCRSGVWALSLSFRNLSGVHLIHEERPGSLAFQHAKHSMCAACQILTNTSPTQGLICRYNTRETTTKPGRSQSV